VQCVYPTRPIAEWHQDAFGRHELVRVNERREEHDGVRIAAIRPHDDEAVFAMLRRCSAETLYHRFHGFSDGIAHATQVLAGIAGHDAYGAWTGDRCIGLASLAADGEGSTHIGVLVEDKWQRTGIGSAFLLTIIERARQLGLPTLTADVLASDRFILPVLARVSSISTSLEWGVFRVQVRLGHDAKAGT
jgi:GNAT superfamily N-acetyltransferase